MRILLSTILLYMDSSPSTTSLIVPFPVINANRNRLYFGSNGYVPNGYFCSGYSSVQMRIALGSITATTVASSVPSSLIDMIPSLGLLYREVFAFPETYLT